MTPDSTTIPRKYARSFELWVNLVGFLVLVLVLGVDAPVGAQQNSTPSAATFDIETASRAYLNRLPPDKKTRSDAYFEGGYWLQLWQFLYGAGLAVLLLQTGLSVRMRNVACRIIRFKPLQTAAYAIQYLVLTALLSFPLTVYSDFFREHKYGLANQNFCGWFGDWSKGLLVNVILGGLLMMALFGVVRKLPRTWHIWGALVACGFLVLTIAIAPVFIAPLFNTYTPLADPKVQDPILRIARANGIKADKVYQMDASKQTSRISANVSGFLGTMRITLNDNLLKRCSLAEIEAVMAHEIGHYVLNHVFKMLVFLAVIIVIGFVWLRWASAWLLQRFGARWGISGLGDVAVTPLIVVLFTSYLFVLTPITNTLIRMQEMEADRFGLNAARQPDGAAEAALKLSEYRKMEPGPIEEWIFYDHPSGATRIRTAMRWKSENIGLETPLPSQK
jgi:STE24 endopeptidase